MDVDNRLAWRDVTPDNWQRAFGHPYVFGQALAALAVFSPRGFLVTGKTVAASLPSDVEATEVRDKLRRTVYRLARHQRTLDRLGRLMSEVAIEHVVNLRVTKPADGSRRM